MLRQLSYPTRMLAVAATFALPTVTLAQADNRPVVVVYTFDNSAFGAGRADLDGIKTGVQDLLITELASNTKIRLVDRARINELLQEQNLVKGGAIDPATAIRLGKMLGAQYAVTGGLIADMKQGTAILTGRTIDIETSQIANPQKIQGKTDNILGIIADLSTKLSSEMKLDPKPGAGRRVGDAGDAAKSGPAQSGSPASANAPAKATGSQVETWAKPVSKPEAMKSTKLDVSTMKIYSAALEEMDKKNSTKARDLFTQVLAKAPGFEPAQRNLDKLSQRAGN